METLLQDFGMSSAHVYRHVSPDYFQNVGGVADVQHEGLGVKPEPAISQLAAPRVSAT